MSVRAVPDETAPSGPAARTRPIAGPAPAIGRRSEVFRESRPEPLSRRPRGRLRMGLPLIRASISNAGDISREMPPVLFDMPANRLAAAVSGSGLALPGGRAPWYPTPGCPPPDPPPHAGRPPAWIENPYGLIDVEPSETTDHVHQSGHRTRAPARAGHRRGQWI